MQNGHHTMGGCYYIFSCFCYLSFHCPTKGITNITIQETKDKFKDKKVQFIDVRTPGEYRANHRPQFKNISLSELPKKVIRWTKTKR